MNDLSLLKSQMSSLEISEITGKRHADVIRDIRVLIEQLGSESERNFALSDYKDSTGRNLPLFLLDKKGCLCLASGYDAKLRMSIIDRWEELETEKKQGIQVPTSFREALLLAAEQQLQIEQQQAQLIEQAPKVDFFDAVADSKDAISIGDLSKILGIKGYGRNNLFEFLRNKKVLMDNNTPMQRYQDMGLFRVIEQKFMKDNEPCINIKTLVYQKGVQYVRDLINKELKTK